MLSTQQTPWELLMGLGGDGKRKEGRAEGRADLGQIVVRCTLLLLVTGTVKGGRKTQRS